MKKIIFSKIVSVLFFMVSLPAFAGIGWHVTFVNMSDKQIEIKRKSDNCFYFYDFESVIVIPARSKIDTYSEEKNSGTCNATFYRIHQLDLSADVLDDSLLIESYFSMSFIGNFANPPFGAFTPPSLTLIAGATSDTVGESAGATISSSTSTAYGIVILGQDGKPSRTALYVR